jgi:hypothetical protein
MINVETHRHLGLIFNNKATWFDHIKSTSDSSMKRLGVLRSLTYTFDRKTLETLYFSFIRSSMEYAAAVWDSCSINEANILENVQVEAARTVTGLPKYCSIAFLYSEVSWNNLQSRRKIKKLILMYKIVNNIAPSYLTDLLPPLVGNQVVRYQLRNNKDIRNYRTRTSLFQNSFFPSTISLWNDLDENIKLSITVGQFVYRIKQFYRPDQPPAWYLHGSQQETEYSFV